MCCICTISPPLNNPGIFLDGLEGEAGRLCYGIDLRIKIVVQPSNSTYTVLCQVTIYLHTTEDVHSGVIGNKVIFKGPAIRHGNAQIIQSACA